MEFTKTDLPIFSPELLEKCQRKLSKVFFDLAISYDNYSVTGYASELLKKNVFLGGDPFVYQMLVVYPHIATGLISTAATDGKNFYWNPHFVMANSILQLRFVGYHECSHGMYNHVDRRGSRDPHLWNIAVDYTTNFLMSEDLRVRQANSKEAVNLTNPFLVFEMGNAVSIADFKEMYSNPQMLKQLRKEIAASKDIKSKNKEKPSLYKQAMMENRVLTPEEDAEIINSIIERRKGKPALPGEVKLPSGYFIDPNLPEDLRTPEQIYDHLFKCLPRCPDCGQIGLPHKKPDPKPKKEKSDQSGEDKQSGDGEKDEKQTDEKQTDENQKGDKGGHDKEHSHGDGESCDCDDHGEKGQEGEEEGEGEGSGCGSGSGGCGTCGGSEELFSQFGDLMDEHLDSEVSQEDMAKRLSEAIKVSSQSAGKIPAGFEEELGELVKPTLDYRDAIRMTHRRYRDGSKKSDYSRFKKRSILSGLFIPKRKDPIFSAAILIDCSGSMSQEDIANGVSELQVMPELSDGWMIPADAEIYWDQAIRIKSVKPDQLSKFKAVGRGGTMFESFFTEYEENIGEQNLIVVITDGYLYGEEMTDPGIPVIWIVTNNQSGFEPAFGKVFEINR